MVDVESTNGIDHATEKKEKIRKRSSSKGKRRSMKKEKDEVYTNGDKLEVESDDAENSDEDRHTSKVPSRTRSTKKERKKSLSKGSDHKPLMKPRRSVSDDSFTDHGDQDEKLRSSARSLKSPHSRKSKKEDKKPSVPRRLSEREEKPSSGRSLNSKKSRSKDKSKNSDKLPTKPGRRSLRQVTDDEEDDLNHGSFHSLKKDSDKPRRRSRSSTGKKSRSKSRSRSKSKTSSTGRVHRRKLKDKPVNDEDDDESHEMGYNDEEGSTNGSTRSKKERRKDRSSHGDGRKLKSNSSHGSRVAKGSKRDAMRKSNSESRIKTTETEGAPVRRRAKGSDGMSKSSHSHSKVKRNHSSRTKGLTSRSYHGEETDRRSTSGGKRTPRKSSRKSHTETSSSVGDESIESFGDTNSYDDSRSQGTLESIEDYEDFGEDYNVYGMEMQTPGMVDFDQEMLDLMQRANPEVTDHLDRRVHRKREMVAYDQNMPMMTRQALLTRQASSQLRRQMFDGSNIDKNRILLRNDSMSSSNRGMARCLHGRRAPPRAKSSGLGAMSRGGYDGDDRRGVFRSRSGQAASFNQHYQNKPNKVRNISRMASGDLVGSRGSRSEHRRRPVQRAASTTALRRANSADYVSPVKPLRLSSPKEEDKDMSNKRNRSKLHLLMYQTKMKVDMDNLFKKVRDGESPRSPIDSLRMPSP